MKVYIAGPMRGYKNFNFDAFDNAEIYLADKQFVPVSPAAIDRWHEKWGKYPPVGIEFTKNDFVRFLARDLLELSSCDAIYLLKGWQDSKGALVEKAYAEYLGLEIMYEEEV